MTHEVTPHRTRSIQEKWVTGRLTQKSLHDFVTQLTSFARLKFRKIRFTLHTPEVFTKMTIGAHDIQGWELLLRTFHEKLRKNGPGIRRSGGIGFKIIVEPLDIISWNETRTHFHPNQASEQKVIIIQVMLWQRHFFFWRFYSLT